jgi:Kef-type K+ transport system membrane component KefB
VLAACTIALVTGLAVAAAEYVVLARVTPLSSTKLLLMAGGIGAACSETTRDAVRWVVERHRAKGPLADLLGEIADSDDLVPLVATALLFALAPVEHARVALPDLSWAGVTLGLGVLLGLLTSALLGRETRLHESWGVMLGTALFAIGLAVRLKLPFVTMMFFMGIALGTSSRHRDDIAAMIAPTEQPVLLPALVLAGARINPQATPHLPLIVGTAIGVRLFVKLVVGFLVWRGYRVARPAGASLGLGLLSTGALAMAVGLSFALRFPGVVGDTILVTVAAVTVFGEFVGPTRLRIALTRAGEIAESKTAPADLMLPAPPNDPEALGP